MDAALGQALLVRARNAIAEALGAPCAPEPDHPALHRRGATFVTLTRHGELRGCIGTLEARRDLDADVRANAEAAAFRDPRFQALSKPELAQTRVEVSLLSAPVPMEFTSEAELLAQLRPGVDGLILEGYGRRGTFLPQVWETLPTPRRFLAHLKEKAGFPQDFWSPDIKVYRYEVEKWKEPPMPQDQPLH